MKKKLVVIGAILLFSSVTVFEVSMGVTTLLHKFSVFWLIVLLYWIGLFPTVCFCFRDEVYLTFSREKERMKKREEDALESEIGDKFKLTRQYKGIPKDIILEIVDVWPASDHLPGALVMKTNARWIDQYILHSCKLINELDNGYTPKYNPEFQHILVSCERFDTKNYLNTYRFRPTIATIKLISSYYCQTYSIDGSMLTD